MFWNKIKLESLKKIISFKIEMNRVSKDVSKEVLDIYMYVYKVSVFLKIKNKIYSVQFVFIHKKLLLSL